MMNEFSKFVSSLAGGSRFRGLLTFVPALLLALLLPVVASAQVSTGSITGRLSDPGGAVVAGAAVTIEDKDTHIKNVTKTNGSGLYNVESLNPGTYTVTFVSKGFEQLVTDNIIVSAGTVVPVDGKMKVGGESQTVTVQASAELLSTSSDVSTTVDRQIVENLPYPERSALEAVLLVPGVTGDTLNPGGIGPENPNAFTNYFSPGASITIGGAPPGTAAIIVDGSDVLEASYPRAGLNLSGRTIQETTVVVAGASAKYGRTGGGVIVETTRAGTSQYHGGATYRHTDPFFWATTPGQLGKTNQHEQFYGVYLGGPVRIPKLYHGDDKTFFFASFEPTRIHEVNGLTRGLFLSPAELAGQFHNSTGLLNQTILKSTGYAAALAAPRVSGIGFSAPTTVGPTNPMGLFPNGIAYTAGNNVQATGPLSDCTSAGINQEDFTAMGTPATVCHDDLGPQLAANPFAQFVFSQMPSPANPGPYVFFDNQAGTPNFDGFNAYYRRGVVNTDNRYNIRLDHQFNNNNQVYARYTTIPVNAGRVFAVAATNPINQTPTDDEHGYDISIGYTHVISSTLINNFHYSWFRENLTRLPPSSATTQDFSAKYGLIPAILGYGFPALGSFASAAATLTVQPGGGGTGFSKQVDQNFIAGNDLTLQRGPHTINFGGEFRWIQSNQYDLNGATGGKYTFTDTSSATTPGYANSKVNLVGVGSSAATFILGVSGYSNTPLQVPGYYRYKYWAAYFQDDWRASAKVTLNMGLRYEVQIPREEAKDNQGFVSQSPIVGTLNGITTNTAFCFSNQCGNGRSLWPTNYFGLEPHIGIAYAATQKMVLRASYAITRIPLTGLENTPDPDFSSSSTTSTPVNSLNQANYITNPISAASLTSPYTQLNGNRGPINFSQGVAPVFVDQTKAVPNIQNYTASIQYQPFSKTLMQITYQGSRGEHLYGQFVAKNVPNFNTLVSAIQSNVYLNATAPNTYGIRANNNAVGGAIQTETAFQALEPYQNFYNQALNNIYPRNSDSHYNAMYLSVVQRATKTLTLNANYTWLKSLDNVPSPNVGAAGSGSSAQQTPDTRSTEYSVSTFDQDSAFKAGYNLNLPFGIGQRYTFSNGFLSRLIGNISTSGFVTSVVGFPNQVTLGNAGYFYSVVPVGTTASLNGVNYTCPASATTKYCVSAELPSGYALRPNIVPGVPLINKNWRDNPYNIPPVPSGVTPYLNAAAFSVPGSVGNPQLGNAPRTLSNARSPREFLFDARVVKGFTIKDRYQFNVNATLSNAFNHPVYFGANKTLYAGASTNTNPATLQGAVVNNLPATAFGTLGNAGAQVMSRVIRVGAEFNF